METNKKNLDLQNIFRKCGILITDEKFKQSSSANWNRIAKLVLHKNKNYFDEKLSSIKYAIKLKLLAPKSNAKGYHKVRF